MLAKAADADEAISLLTAQHSIALNSGNPELALEATRRMQRMRPAGRAHLRLRILDALYDEGDSLAAVAAVRRLEATPDVPGAAADMCVSAQWHIAHGELEKARSVLDILRAQSAQKPLLSGVQPEACAPSIEAAVSVASRSPQSGPQLQALDSLAFTNTGIGDLAAYANIAVAKLHQNLNAPERALAAIRRRPYGTAVWPRYHATALRIELELCAAPELAQQCHGE